MEFYNDYMDAMEALDEENRKNFLCQSKELICHCNPISYKEAYNYVFSLDSENIKTEQILSALRIAQGCGTCLNSAELIIKELLDLKKLKKTGKE